MENEPPSSVASDEVRASTKRGRFNMGKLFGRERKVPSPEASNDLNDFLRGSSDRLAVEHSAPPQLSKLDTTSVHRYPNAFDVHNAPNTQRSLSLRQPPRRARNKAGLVVRFADSFPEIIGHGGDECDIPTAAIAKQKMLRPPPVTAFTAPAKPVHTLPGALPEVVQDENSFIPIPIRRTQTGYSSVSEVHSQPEIPAGMNAFARHLDTPVIPQDEKRKSFIEVQQAAMREAEGAAFANAVRSASPSHNEWDEKKATPPEPEPERSVSDSPDTDYSPLIQFPPARQVPGVSSPPLSHPLPPPPQVPPPSQSIHTAESPMAKLRRAVQQGIDQSPSSVRSESSFSRRPYDLFRAGSKVSEPESGSVAPPQATISSLHDVVFAVADDAMDIFITRTRHLFELFRLHSETVRPLLSCEPEELARASLWWFLRGRMTLEKVLRERPTDPDSQARNENARQQAYADLAKAYWLSEEILPEVLESKHTEVSREVEEVCSALNSSLRKLAVSMKRNGFLPPEEALLPAHLDRSIWTEYPHLAQDIVALLCGSSSSGFAQPQHGAPRMSLLEALPLGDSPVLFCFGSVHADVFLMEQGLDSQIYLSCLLSIVRLQNQADLTFVIASQNGAVQLRVSATRKLGPVWDDVRWRPESCTLDIKLPRGFLLVIRCSQQDYRMLSSMYEFSTKIQSSLSPQQDEQCIFRATLPSFQYFDNDPQARQFPREPVADCELALHERVFRKGHATGPRSFHRGYRIAVATGPRTRTLSGVNQVYSPQMPVQFGFLVGENQSPALSVSFEKGKTKGSMVMTFSDKDERIRMHRLLVGTALHKDEYVFAEVTLTGLWISERFGEANQKSLAAVSILPWQKVSILNYDDGGGRPPCVLADKLRVVFEFGDGTVTDRVNVAPGELKLRFDVQNPSCMMIFRQPQNDMTVAIAENTPSSHEKSQIFAQALDVMQKLPTIRTVMFPSVEELHKFETALTGFKILYDGVAAAFAIARRRMVVPIHKKWEAGATRLQVVQQDGATQLLAFFEDFAHGQCMSFALKGTDVFEAFARGSKAGLKIDDAKFPLPKILENVEDTQAVGDAAFVCLDLPELPGEHDDISILFDNDAERQRFIDCLPAPVKGPRYARMRGSKN